MADLLDGLHLLAGDNADDDDEESVGGDSDLEVVNVDNLAPEEDAADLGDLIMVVGAEEVEPLAEEEERPPRTVAEIVHCVAEKEQTRKRPDVLTVAAIVYHLEHMSKSKKRTAHHFEFSAVVGAKQVLGYVTRKEALLKHPQELRNANKPLDYCKSLSGSGCRAAHSELDR